MFLSIKTYVLRGFRCWNRVQNIHNPTDGWLQNWDAFLCMGEDVHLSAVWFIAFECSGAISRQFAALTHDGDFLAESETLLMGVIARASKKRESQSLNIFLNTVR